MSLKARLAAALKALEWLTKNIAAILAAVAIIAFLIPPIGRLINVLTAWRFGVVGAVYYGVDDRGYITCGSINKATGQRIMDKCGGIHLVRSGSNEYDNISMGDLLQAHYQVNFRAISGDENYMNDRPIFVLKPGDCMIVLDRLKQEPYPDFNIASGGWLKVATAACGIFK